MRGGWCTKAISGPYRVMLWKYIQREWTQFSQFIKFAVSDGSRIKFWSDAWCGTVSLKSTFPELCHITQDKEALVADHMHLHNGSVHWKINFIQAAQDRELESLSSFLDLSYSIDVQGHEEDKLCSSQSS